jgi:disulfide bond formation protein DsbB
MNMAAQRKRGNWLLVLVVIVALAFFLHRLFQFYRP